jgi:hypothetical protein
VYKNKNRLEQAANVAVAKKRFVDLQRRLVWRLPERKLVRYVRVQLEQQNFLTLAQVICEHKHHKSHTGDHTCAE